MIPNALRTNYRGGEPVRNLCDPEERNAINAMLTTMQGVGCRVVYQPAPYPPVIYRPAPPPVVYRPAPPRVVYRPPVRYCHPRVIVPRTTYYHSYRPSRRQVYRNQSHGLRW